MRHDLGHFQSYRSRAADGYLGICQHVLIARIVGVFDGNNLALGHRGQVLGGRQWAVRIVARGVEPDQAQLQKTLRSVGRLPMFLDWRSKVKRWMNFPSITRLPKERSAEAREQLKAR